jgi:hypothetical protein
MHLFITIILATSLVSLAGCASYVKQSEVCTKGYYGYDAPSGECPTRGSSGAMAPKESKDSESRMATLERENQGMTAELNAIQRSSSSLRQLIG